MDENQDRMDNGAERPPAHSSGPGALAQAKLHRSAYRALQHVSCEFRSGVLTLRGRLSSYYLKQIAQMLASTVEGVEQIDNQIEVITQAAPHADTEPPDTSNSGA